MFLQRFHRCLAQVGRDAGKLQGTSLQLLQTVRHQNKLWPPTYSSRSQLSTDAAPKNKLFRVIEDKVDKTSDEYKRNLAASEATVGKYEEVLGLATGLGGAKAIGRHVEKNKKILVTDRMKLLFDDADEVLEIGKFAGLAQTYGNIPRAGIYAAVGRINGVLCMVIANDATVKAGTIYPIGVKKQLRLHEIAEENHIPCVFVVDSGGAFLPLQADIFLPGGRSFYNEAIMNSKGIPQLAIVCGSCTAGAAYVPTMAQEAIIVDKIGTIFLGGPPLVYAALGEIVSPEKLGGATVHCSVSGCTDHFAGTEEEAMELGRDVVATFNIPPAPTPGESEEPRHDPRDLLGIIPATDQHNMDMYQVISRIVDGSRFHEFKAMFGTNLVTGFAYIKGYLVGILGNRGEMTEAAAVKGSHFVQLCDQRSVPLIFLQNTAPDNPDLHNPQKAAEMGVRIRGHAKLMSSVATATVPKVTIICGNAIGPESYMMCGRSFDPRFVFCWPNAKVGIENPETICDKLLQAAKEAGKEEEDLEKIKSQVSQKTSSVHSSGHLWDDGIILPQETRKVLGQCLEIFSQKPALKEIKQSVMRM